MVSDFVALNNRDKWRWVVMVAWIDHTETCAAVTYFDEARRYIVI